MQIDSDGWLGECVQLASPNYDSRPDGQVDLLVIHNISLPPNQFGGDAVQRFFLNTLDTNEHPYYRAIAGVKVSSHFFIRRDGELLQFVSCFQRAWHAGVSCWQGRSKCNDFSIGIELEGADDVPYLDAQYTSLIRLTRVLRERFPNMVIVGHSDIAPARKTDPGESFDWLCYLRFLAE